MNREVPSRSQHRRPIAVALMVAFALVLLPASASAEVKTETFDVGPVTLDGYAVEQSYLGAPHPRFADSDHGFVTAMEVDVVDANGKPIPIQRMMLHHIVFANLGRPDETCESITGFDGRLNPALASERFYAAGEERAEMVLPKGYGYRVDESDPWALLYMFMNHREVTDSAYIRYTMTTVSGGDAAGMKRVDPYWMDVVNCHADPIYNVRGGGERGSSDIRRYDYTMPVSGRIVAGGGHVHGGGKRLALTEPDCGNRELARSLPTWGKPNHPFYNVRPVLHEPGPINMSGFNTQTGFPIAAGQRLRLKSVYDDAYPHTRVMGIMIVYVDPDDPDDPTDDVANGCGPLPRDVVRYRSGEPGRNGPIVPYPIPLTGLDEEGKAVTIKNPPGKLRRAESGTELLVGDRFFLDKNVKVRRGARLKWRFASEELHNVTLANGPIGIGSENLNEDRTFAYRFKKKGTYRFFCALHPVDMTERVVVVGKRGKRKQG